MSGPGRRRGLVTELWGWAQVWPALLAVGTVGAVGVPAAVASYRHARDVIAAHGDPVMAPFLPLSVDGMLVAALVVIWVRRHRGDRAGAFPWCAFGFGMVVTVLANLAAVAEPSPVAVAVALFPPLALAVTLELVALVAYRSAPRAPTHQHEPESVGSTHVDAAAAPQQLSSGAPSIAEVGKGQDSDDEQSGATEPNRRDATRPPGAGDPRVRELAGVLASRGLLTGAEVAARFGCSPRTGRRLLAAAQQRPAEQAANEQDPHGIPGLALVTTGGGA